MMKYLIVYHGGMQFKENIDMQEMMKIWQKWIDDMGDTLVDKGYGVYKSKTVMGDGSVEDNGGSNPASGYCLIKAENEEEALTLAKEHPFLSLFTGTSVEIAQVHEQ